MDLPLCSKCGASLRSEGTTPLDLSASVGSGTRRYELIHSNEPPEDSELGRIRSTVSRADARLARIEEEISKLRAKLEVLEEEHDSLLEYRTQSKEIMSPLRRMPAELLVEIFSCPSSYPEEGQPYMAHVPWVFTRVSRRWRNVALSTPSLWSRIVIDYGVITEYFPESTLQLERQIQRAQDVGSKVHFFGSELSESSSQTRMFEVLLQHSSRWEELDLILSSQLFALLPRLRDRLSSLKRLSLEWASLTSHITIQSIDYFSSASSLVDFTFDNQSCVPVTLPANLTRYDVYAPWHMHSKVLKLCPYIVDARITVEPWTEFSLDVLVLKHLERLYASTPEILNYIHAPQLEGLAFHIRDKDRDAVVLSSMDTLIQCSACTLKSLCLKGLPSDILTATQLLRNLSAITQLTIIADTYAAAGKLNELVTHLAVHASAEIAELAPQLRSFFVGSSYGNCDIDWESYSGMVKSRWEAENCDLSTALVAGPGHGGPDYATMQEFDTIRRQGFRFQYKSGILEMNSWDYTATWMFFP